jgi:hypothetical protein
MTAETKINAVACKHSHGFALQETKKKRLPAISYRWNNHRHPKNKQLYMHVEQYRIVVCSIFIAIVVGSAGNYHAACPPSILKSLPVIKLLASLIKNTAAPRYSSGRDRRPNIFCLGHSSRRSGNCTNRFSTIWVTMYPGLMVLTRMLYWPHSAARLRPSWMTAALEAL